MRTGQDTFRIKKERQMYATEKKITESTSQRGDMLTEEPLTLYLFSASWLNQFGHF